LPGTISLEEINSRLAAGELPGLGIRYTNFRPTGALLAIMLFMLNPILDFGFMSYCVKITRAQSTEFKDLFNGFLYFTKVISIFLLSTVFVFLWSLLLFIPGIVAAYRYRLAYYILLDDPEKGALQCIHESKLLMNGKKLDLLILDISFIGWYILDLVVIAVTPFSFAIPFVSIYLSPYTGIARAAFYEDQIAIIAV
jgi:uncharacterized membrane protein